MHWSPHRRARAHRKVVAMEVELIAEVTDRDVRHLLWLRERLGADFRRHRPEASPADELAGQ